MVGIGHTPGPWLVDPNYVGDIITSDGVDLATTWHEGSAGKSLIIADSVGADYEQMKANTILMAAAPDLVEALQWALAELNGKTRYDDDVADQQIENCYTRAEAAIAKATGQ